MIAERGRAIGVSKMAYANISDETLLDRPEAETIIKRRAIIYMRSNPVLDCEARIPDTDSACHEILAGIGMSNEALQGLSDGLEHYLLVM